MVQLELQKILAGTPHHIFKTKVRQIFAPLDPDKLRRERSLDSRRLFPPSFRSPTDGRR